MHIHVYMYLYERDADYSINMQNLEMDSSLSQEERRIHGIQITRSTHVIRCSNQHISCLIIYFLVFFVLHPAVLRGYSWLGTKELLLAGLENQMQFLWVGVSNPCQWHARLMPYPLWSQQVMISKCINKTIAISIRMEKAEALFKIFFRICDDSLFIQELVFSVRTHRNDK